MGSIFGVTIEPLKPDAQSGRETLMALRYGDHWLRRFGLAELIRLDQERTPHLQVRQSADEVWVIFSGSATLHMVDTRPDSPTQGQSQVEELRAPARALIPFGVAAGLQPIDGPVQWLRLATHSDDEALSEQVDWEAP